MAPAVAATEKRPDAAVPLDIRPAYEPHLHQLQAWQRPSSRNGATPLTTLVTTESGSRKTECFFYPVLDASDPLFDQISAQWSRT